MIDRSVLIVAAEVLDIVSDRLIEPVELPNTPDVRKVVFAAREVTNVQAQTQIAVESGWVEAEPGPTPISITATMNEIAVHLARVFQEEALKGEEASAKAVSIDELLPLLDADMDAIRKVWMEYGKNPDGTIHDEKARNVLIGAYITLKKFELIAERLARPAFDRNGWRQVEKSIEDTVDKWFKRQADGAPGIRLVKG